MQFPGGIQPQIILLREGTDTSQGKGQLISNINACVAVVDTVRTTLARPLARLRGAGRESRLGSRVDGRPPAISGSGEALRGAGNAARPRAARPSRSDFGAAARHACRGRAAWTSLSTTLAGRRSPMTGRPS